MTHSILNFVGLALCARLVYFACTYVHNAVIEAWSVSSVSVQGLNVDEKETNNASVFISEELLSQQDNGKYCIYVKHLPTSIVLLYCVVTA